MGLRILLVADVDLEDEIGGSVRVLREEATRLLKRGNDVYLLTRNIFTPERVEEVVRGIKVFRYNVKRSNPFSFFLTSVMNSKKLFEFINVKFKIDLINFHQPFSAFGVNLSGDSKNIRKLYTCHSLSFQEYISRNEYSSGFLRKAYFNFIAAILKRIEGYSFNKSDRIRVLSKFTAGLVEENYGILKGKISIIPGGVDMERFSPKNGREGLRKGFNIPEGRFLLCTVRNLVPRMGLENLIMSMRSIKSKIPQVYLLIGGEGQLKLKLIRMVEENNLSDCVKVAGFIPEDNLPDFYRMADFFILPTKELEGFGLVTVEALSCGTPVLGTNVGGTKEILEKLDRELLFNGADEVSLADKIIRQYEDLYIDNKKYTDFREGCRKFAEENYGWEKAVENLESELTLLHKERNRRG